MELSQLPQLMLHELCISPETRQTQYFGSHSFLEQRLISMKDFEKVLTEQSDSEFIPTFLSTCRFLARSLAGTTLLSLVTSPILVGSILLQISNPSPFSQQILKQRKESAKSIPLYNQILEQKADGRNRLFKTPYIDGYADSFRHLGRMGLRGFFKGNLYNILTLFSLEAYTSLMRFALPNFNLKQGFIVTLVSRTFGDLLVNPLLACQSAKVVTLPKKHFFRGVYLHPLKNMLILMVWEIKLKGRPSETFLLCNLLSHFINYPFLTILRRLQTSDQHKSIMELLRKIKGPKDLYRGFTGYALVHSLIFKMMLETGSRLAVNQ